MHFANVPAADDTPDPVDNAFAWIAFGVRTAAYAGLVAFADRASCGAAVLTGLWLGDVAARVVAIAWQRLERLPAHGADLALLGLVWLCVRTRLEWPDDPSLRAIVGLAALGVFAGTTGGSLLNRLGPGERELA